MQRSERYVIGWETTFLSAHEERSLYTVLCSAFLEWHPSEPELSSALRGVSKVVSTFKLSSDELGTVADLLQVNPCDLSHAAGRHLNHQGRGCMLATELRYCPECLGRCWHSALFQHWPVANCPVHGSALRTGCPSCGRAVSLDLKALRRSPFSCDACGTTFLEYRDWNAAVGGPPAALFAPWHDRLSVDLNTYASNRRCATWAAEWKGRHMSSGAQAMRLSRHIWWTNPGAPVLRPRDFTVEISRSHGEPTASVATILFEIEEMLHDHGQYAAPPVTVGATRSSGEIPMLAAAFWRTANRFFSPSEYLRKRERPGGLHAWIEHQPSDWPQACAVLLRSEITSLMCRHILALSSFTFLAEVDWQAPMHPVQYAPAWLLERRTETQATLTVRPVTSQGTLKWLMRRCRDRVLKRAYFDRKLGKLREINDADDSR